MKENRLLKIFLIIIIIFITSHNLQLIPKLIISLKIRHKKASAGLISVFQNVIYDYNDNEYKNNQNISFYFLVSSQSIYCNYLWRDLEFRISECEKYKSGRILKIIGNRLHITANGNYGQNSLLIQSIEPINHSSISDIPLISFLTTLSLNFIHFIFQIKAYLFAVAEFNFSTSTHQLVISMVLGDKSLLDLDTRHLFKITGSLHILAVSGMNVNLLYVLLRLILSRFHRSVRFFSQLIVLCIYTIMVGASASIVRASCMLLYRLVGNDLLFKQTTTSNSLLFVILGMLACNSWFITQVSFQLSAGATGVILFFLLFKKAISGNSKGDTPTWAFLIGSVSNIEFSQDSFGKLGSQKILDGTANTDETDDIDGGETVVGKSLLVRTFESVINYLKETTTLGLVIQLFLAPVLWWHFDEVSWVGIVAGSPPLLVVPPIYLLSLIYFITFAVHDLLFLISSSLITVSNLFFPVIVALKTIGFFLQLVLYFLSQAIEISSQLFLLILTVITNHTQEIALIPWQNFSLITASIWYSILLALFFVVWKYKRTQHNEEEKK